MNSFFVSQNLKFSRQKKQELKNRFQNKKKTDLQDFDKLFIQPQYLANVIKLVLCKFQLNYIHLKLIYMQ